ncbi:MAG: GNAT family N-acetyltransferase [Deltaproteobacteria bacterium HGW-Deltaproteobacteria-14]|nr:MAG: GNAT family N-acetyltransferase [Deltaproteobacteria bacterium HGW-Deltaproteobacteria-14]
MSPSNLYVEVVDHVGAVPAADWDALTGDDNPFVEHAFLKALEDSGSVGPATGWNPSHLLVRGATPDGPDVTSPILGAAPLYAKTDSYGEYIFDWGWANAAHRAGIAFYPKLTSAIPFTPATGPRLLVRPGADRDGVARALAQGAVAVCEQADFSGAHWLFCTAQESALLAAEGYTPRLSRQFHWHNAGYRDFDDFLAAMTTKRRKEVRRERRRAQSHGLDIRVLTGPELRPDHWRALDAFYRRTVGYRGGMDYLTPAFFELLPERLAHRVVAVIAERDGRPVAGTLNFRKGDHLYGRYWGASEDLDALHFECCYYQLVDYAIAEGITLFEAGAQGQHKLARGFVPSLTHSAHLIRHPGLRHAIDAFIEREAEEVRREVAWLDDHAPFRATSE